MGGEIMQKIKKKIRKTLVSTIFWTVVGLTTMQTLSAVIDRPGEKVSSVYEDMYGLYVDPPINAEVEVDSLDYIEKEEESEGDEEVDHRSNLWEEKELERIKRSKEEAKEKLENLTYQEDKEDPYLHQYKEDKDVEVSQWFGNNKIGKEGIKYIAVNTKSRKFTATAYDLSYHCVETHEGDPGHGITANGTDLKNLSRKEAMTVATDPKVIPTGSIIEVEFEDPNFQDFNGIYTANDVGGGVKGNTIDIFMGDFHSSEPHQSTIAFGRRNVKVRVLFIPEGTELK